MKSFISLVLFLICAVGIYAEQYKFDYEYMFCDFNGITFDEEKIIAYGTNSVLLVSYDKGKSWEQRKLNIKEANILKLIHTEDYYYGICRNGIIIKSDNDNLNFDAKIIDEQMTFTDFVIEDEKLFILTLEKNILIYNPEMEYLETIPLDTAYGYRMMIAYNDNLLLPTNYPKILSIKFSDYSEQNIIDVSEYGDYVKDLKVYNEYLFANIGGSVYKKPNLLSAWEKITYSLKSYQIHNDDLYELSVNQNSTWRTAWIDLYKHNTNGQIEREKINIDSVDRFINSSLTINDFQFINDNTIIAVGPGKTIYLSNNAGKTWILKSNILNQSKYTQHKQWLDEMTGFVTNEGHVFSTFDGGTTWLPQKFTDTLIKRIKYFSAFKMFESGEGFAFAFASGTTRYADTIKNMNFVYTRDFGETYVHVDRPELAGNWFPKYPIQIILIDSVYVIFFCPTGSELTAIYTYDKNFNLIQKTFSYNRLIANIDQTSKDTLKAIARDVNPPFTEFDYDSSKFLLMHYPYDANVWEIVSEHVIQGSFPYPAIWEGKDVFFHTQLDYKNGGYGKLYYHFNTVTQKINLIFSDTTYSNIFLFFYKGRIYIKTSDDEVISTKDFQKNYNDIIWRFEVDFPKIFAFPDKISEFWQDNSFYVSSTTNKNGIKYTGLLKFYISPTNVVSDEIEVSQYFFASPPAPSPAKDNVRITVYWDQGIDISSANIKIFNFLGNDITNDNDLTTIPIKSYSQEIIWNCSNFSSGIYFINLSYGSFSRTVPVLVVN